MTLIALLITAEVVDVRPVGIHKHQTLVEHQQTTLKTVCDNFVLRSYVNLQQLDSLLGKTATHFAFYFLFEIKKKQKKQDQNNNSTANSGVYLPQTIYFRGETIAIADCYTGSVLPPATPQQSSCILS